jgi:hypothetical protein
MRILRTVIQAAPGVVLWLAVSAGNAKADVIYTYTGNDFNDIFGTSLTESDFVSASFTFASPLPAGPNFADESGSLLNWTVTDGVNTLSEGDGNYLAGLDLSTDLLGDVSASWNFLAESSPYTSTGPPPDWLEIGSNTGFSTDLSEFWITQSDPAWLASSSNDLGTWTVTTTPTPEPSTTAWTCLLAGAMLLFAMRRRRSS